MSGLPAPNTAVAAWQPDLSGLPDGWRLRAFAVDSDRWHISAQVELEHVHGHKARVIVHQGQPDVREWLWPFLGVVAELPVGAQLDGWIDTAWRHWP